MKGNPVSGWFVNVGLPLLLGVAIYCTRDSIHFPSLIPNHLPDGLWAYSLMSAILLIWQRRIVAGWVLAAFALGVGFEVLQYCHWLPGTGDIYDVLTYFIFFALALILNPIHEKQDKTPPHRRYPGHLRPLRHLFKGQ